MKENNNCSKFKTDLVTKIIVSVLIILIATAILATFSMHTLLTKQRETLSHLDETKVENAEVAQIKGRQDAIREIQIQSDRERDEQKRKIDVMDKCISVVETKVDTVNVSMNDVKRDIDNVQAEQRQQRGIQTTQTQILTTMKEDLKEIKEEVKK